MPQLEYCNINMWSVELILILSPINMPLPLLNICLPVSEIFFKRYTNDQLQALLENVCEIVKL